MGRADRVGLHDAAVVDHRAGQRIRRPGRHDDIAAIGRDQVAVVDQGINGAAIDGKTHKAVAVEIERDLVARGEGHRAQARTDHALVLNLRREQRHISTFGGADQAPVDDRSCCRSLAQHIAAGQEVRVGQAQRRRDDATDVNLRARREQNPIRIEQEHLAVGRQRALDQGRALSQHPVQCDRRRARLVEAHRLAGRDAETQPVDRGPVAGLLNSQFCAGAHNGSVSRRDLGAIRQCVHRSAKNADDECPRHSFCKLPPRMPAVTRTLTDNELQYAGPRIDARRGHCRMS